MSDLAYVLNIISLVFHRTGSAAQIRSQVSVAFSAVDGVGGRANLSLNSFPSGQGSGALVVQSLASLSSLSPPAHPVLVSLLYGSPTFL